MFKGKFLIMFAMIFVVVACKEEQKNTAVDVLPVVETMQIKVQDVPLSIEYSARTQGSKETEVRARVAGILLKRNYVEGSKVEEGDVLFEIDPEPFKVALSQAKAKLAQNQAQLKAAETQWTRVAKLFEERIVSEKSRDEARANLDALKATTALAQAEVDSAQLNLDYSTVKAPIAGITSMESQSEGSLISVNQTLTNLTQLDPIYVIFSASENELLKLGSMIERGLIVNPAHSDKKITAQVKYGNGELYNQEGEINFINPSVDESTGTVKARAVFPNPEKKLMPGQFVRLVLGNIIRKNAVLIPQEAVMQRGNGSFVYKVNAQSMVEMVKVETGKLNDDGMWIIDEGLQDGDMVIVNGLMKVKPGMAVESKISEIVQNKLQSTMQQ